MIGFVIEAMRKIASLDIGVFDSMSVRRCVFEMDDAPLAGHERDGSRDIPGGNAAPNHMPDSL